MWNDIDLYHAYRDFTTDPNRFPPEQVRMFIEELVSFFRVQLLRRLVYMNYVDSKPSEMYVFMRKPTPLKHLDE